MRLMTIVEVQHFDVNGTCLWRAFDLPNTVHTQGQEFILKSLFARSAGVSIPDTYYLGLDNRPTIQTSDIMASIVGEPTNNGYTRKSFGPADFTAVFDSVKWRATTTTLVFNAMSGSWGPIQNAFLTTAPGTAGMLLASVKLPQVKSLTTGQSFTFRFVLGLEG